MRQIVYTFKVYKIMKSNISSDMNKPCWKLAKACPQSQKLFCFGENNLLVTVTMTGEETVRITMPDGEIAKEGSGLSELGSSPLGSFQLIQSSEIDKMISYVPSLGEVKILQFEDTLSEEDRKNFNLIYESLLLEGKVGNLTDLTLGMVLAKNLCHGYRSCMKG